jgi:uncharacterized protein YndB with AHSA1/START domain
MTTTGDGALQLTLPTETQILITREVAAPRQLVWRAWTTPELVRRWWAGRRGEMTVAEVDLRVGGRWRYVMTATDGHEVAFHGTYRELSEPERIVHTEVYEMPGAPETPEDQAPVVTVTFTERDGRTTVELLTECHSRELRDMIAGSGMEVGVREQFELVEELAASLA